MRGPAPILALCLLACGAPAPNPDAGISPDAARAPEEPAIPWLDEGRAPVAPPEIPWLEDGEPAVAAPALRPCSAGWREVTSPGGLDYCDPAPEGGAPACAAGEAYFLGETECRPIGRVCPTGPFPEALPDGPVIYVRARAPSHGDGSAPNAPLATIGEALAVAPDGAVVAVASGLYDEDLVIERPVRLVGACVTGTLLTSTRAGEGAALIEIRDADVLIRDLGVVDPARPALRVSGGSSGGSSGARLEGVLVRNATGVGLDVDGAELEVSELVVRGVAGAGDEGRAVRLRRGRLVLERAELSGAARYGLDVAGEGAELEVDGARLVGNGPGAAAIVADGARATFTELEVTESRGSGIVATGEGTSITLRRAFLRTTRRTTAETLLGGVHVLEGAEATLSGVVLDTNEAASLRVVEGRLDVEDLGIVYRFFPFEQRTGQVELGLGLAGVDAEAVGLRRAHIEAATIGIGMRGTTLAAEDLRIRDMQATFGARSVDALDADVTIERLVSGPTEGVHVYVAGGTLRGRDWALHDTQDTPREEVAIGYVGGSDVLVERALFENASGVGLYDATGGASRIVFRDVVMRNDDARPIPNGQAFALVQTELTLERVTLQGHHGPGLLAGEGTIARLTDVSILDHEPWPDRVPGVGLELASGARAELVRVDVAGNRGAGLIVTSRGDDPTIPTVTLEDVSLRHTREMAAGGALGVGAWIENGATVEGRRVLIAGNRMAGLVADAQARVELEDLVVRDTAEADCEGCDPRGFGLVATGRANVDLTRFRLEDNPRCAALVGPNGGLDLHGGFVVGSPVGVCVQQEGFPLDRLRDGVGFVDVGADIETTTYVVPSLSEVAPRGYP